MRTHGATAAIVQAAVDAERLGVELDALFDRIENTDSQLLDWRVDAGRMLTEARKAFPAKGPKSAAWGEFLKARKLSQQSAARYMRLTAFVVQHPALRGEPVHVIYERMGEAGAGWSRESSSAERFSGQQPLLTARTDTPPAAGPVQGTLEVREGDATREQAERDAAERVRAAAEQKPGERLTLFPEGPGAELAEKPLPPASPRTAAPGATTLILPTEEPCPSATSPTPSSVAADGSSGPTTPTNLSDAAGAGSPSAASPASAPSAFAATDDADEQAARAADLDAELVDQQDQLARGEEVKPRRAAAAKPDEPYEVAERVALLRTSPVFRNLPEDQRGAFAAALREWADSLAPEDPEDTAERHDIASLKQDIQDAYDALDGGPLAGLVSLADTVRARMKEATDRAAAAEARVRELEARRDEHEAFCKELDLSAVQNERDDARQRVRELEAQIHDLRNELTKASLREQAAAAGIGDAGREQQAARDGYAQGEEEALRRVAEWVGLGGCPPGTCGKEECTCKADAIATALEEQIGALREQRDVEQKRRRQLEEEQEIQAQAVRARMQRMAEERDQWKAACETRDRVAQEEAGGLRALLKRTANYLETATDLIAENDVCVDDEDEEGGDLADARALVAEARAALDGTAPQAKQPPAPAPTCGAQHPTGPAVCGETSPHPRGRHRGAPPHEEIEWADVPPRRAPAKAARVAVRAEGPPVDLGGAEGPVQVELITVRDDAPPPAAKKKPARKPAAAPPASPWTLGAQVLAPVKSGPRRAVVVNLGREDTISVVLRKEGKLKAEVPTRAYRPEDLTEDPRADQGGIREALVCLKAAPIPPVEWIAALEDL